MHRKSLFRSLLLAALLTFPGLAQIAVTASAPPGEPVTLTFTQGTARLSTITGFPYSAIDTLEQVLPKGTHFSIASTPIYRDSMGRTRTERRQYISEIKTFLTRWRAIGTCYAIDPEEKTAIRAPVKVRQAQALDATPRTLPHGVESLGTQTIDGLITYGERSTSISPAGSGGADRPTTHVDERWESPQLGIVMVHKMTTPRTPNILTTIGDLQFAEPDAALFRVPEGLSGCGRSSPLTARRCNPI